MAWKWLLGILVLLLSAVGGAYIYAGVGSLTVDGTRYFQHKGMYLLWDPAKDRAWQQGEPFPQPQAWLYGADGITRDQCMSQVHQYGVDNVGAFNWFPKGGTCHVFSQSGLQAGNAKFIPGTSPDYLGYNKTALPYWL